MCKRSNTPTAAECYIATSSLATSCSGVMAKRWWSIGDWPKLKAGMNFISSQTSGRFIRALSSGSAATEMGSIIGTPGYMSPEQAAGRLDELGPVSDVYSLGATLYAVLTGRSPLGKGTVDDLLRQISLGTFPRPREIQPNLPKPLEAICTKAMALDPEEPMLWPRDWPRTSSVGWPTSRLSLSEKLGSSERKGGRDGTKRLYKPRWRHSFWWRRFRRLPSWL